MTFRVTPILRTLMVLLPVAVFLAIALYLLDRRERAGVENALARTATSTVAAIDRQLASEVAVLEALATTPTLGNAALDDFIERAERVVAQRQSWLAIIITNHEAEVAGTGSGTGPRLAPLVDAEGIDAVFRTAKPHVSGVFRPNARAPEPFYIVRVPVFRDGGVVYTLAAIVRAWTLHDTLMRLPIPENGRIGVLDRDRRIIARTSSHAPTDELIGKLPSLSVQEAVSGKPETLFTAQPLDDHPVYGVAKVHDDTGWAAVVTAPQNVLEAPRRRMLLLSGAGAGIALLLTVAFGAVMARASLRRVEAERRLSVLEAEAGKHFAEERLRVALEAGHIGTFDRRLTDDVLVVDGRYKAMFGFAADEPVDFSGVCARIHPDDRSRFKTAVTAAQDPAGDGVYAAEYRIVWPDGTLRWIEARGQVRFATVAGERRAERFTGAIVDLTDRKAAEQALRDSGERLRLAAEVAGFGTFDWDVAGDRHVWSPETYALYGIAQDTPLTSAVILAALHPEDRDRLSAVMKAWLDPAGPGEWSMEHRVVAADGEVRWLHARLRAFFARDGGGRRAVRVIGAVQDITERRATVEALSTANAELERRVEERTAQLLQTQKMEAVGQLTAGVAHDFNNVLQGVGSCLAALESRAADGQGRPLFEAAQQGIQRGARLTQHLLAFARRQTLSPKPTNVGELLEGMRPLLERSMGGLIRIGIASAEGTWPALVDATQLELAVLNLAINARDAMPLGGMLSLRVANADEADANRSADLKPGDYVVVSVSDTGTGMDAATQARVFEPFFSTKETGKGSGLGLSMVHGMAAQSGGGVHLVSQPGRGTTVSIYLPRAEVVVGEAAVSPAEATPHADGVVLLVDDDALVRLGARAVLETLGYTILEADGGPAALTLLHGSTVIDVLVTDYAMPGMNGAALADEARRLRPNLPVLMMTGYVECPSDVTNLALLQKPFRPQELAAEIAALLRRKEHGNVVPFAPGR